MVHYPTSILIVDDDAGSAQSLASVLQEGGYGEVRAECSAASALGTAITFTPGIIFVDIELPDMSGYEVARLLHQHPRLQNMRLIALTDSGEHPRREHARASGFERYLVKPITAAALRETMELLSQ